MTKTFMCYCLPALLCAMLPRFVSADSGTPALDADLEVTRFVFARDVVDRQPQDEVLHIPVDGHRVYGFIEVLNQGPPRQVAMVWRRDGKEMARFQLDVGRSPRWRTWSYLHARRAMQGEWEVTVEDEQGNRLGRESLIIGNE